MNSKNQKYDVLVFGATPAGIACSVRAARENLSVLLVSYFPHVGGMPTNGLGVWDTLYEGNRSPVYDEIRLKIFEYYKKKYGLNSSQYLNALPGKTGHSNGTFEPNVFEEIVNEIIKKEKRICLITGLYPKKANTKNNIIRSLEFSNSLTNQKLTLKATFYVDCSYEGDLLPVLNLPYRLGRESRNEFKEPHAGKIFIRQLNPVSYEKGLDLRQFGANQVLIYPESNGEANNNIQAFNIRMVLSSDPVKKIEILRPENYNPNEVQELEYDSHIQLPNNKICWNRPQLLDSQNKYIEGSWSVRNEIISENRKAALSLLFFLQNDPSVPNEVQRFWKNYGLPKDEFADNGHLPYEIYVREGRRLIGESIITQYDLMPDSKNARAPVKYDSIGITEWYMDTHACSAERARDSLKEGTMMLYYESYPGQIPFRSTYNKKLKNFLVPVCLSSTHVAWGGIRLEPTWMNIAESVALAVEMCINENKWIDTIEIDKLQIKLAEKCIMIGFFNKIDIHSYSPYVPAIQYFSTKGFFRNYNFSPEELINKHLAEIWIQKCRLIIDKDYSLLEKLPEQINSFSAASKEFFNKTLKKNGFNQRINGAKEELNYGQVVLFLYDLIKSQLFKNYYLQT